MNNVSIWITTSTQHTQNTSSHANLFDAEIIHCLHTEVNLKSLNQI